MYTKMWKCDNEENIAQLKLIIIYLRYINYYKDSCMHSHVIKKPSSWVLVLFLLL